MSFFGTVKYVFALLKWPIKSIYEDAFCNVEKLYTEFFFFLITDSVTTSPESFFLRLTVRHHLLHENEIPSSVLSDRTDWFPIFVKNC